MPIGDTILSGVAHSIVAADLSENFHDEAFSGYFMQNPFSRILLNTTATSIDLVTNNNIAGTGYPAEVMVKVNGAYHSTLSFGSTGDHTFSGITFSAGAKIIEFITGFKNDPSGTVQGMWLKGFTANQDATIIAPTTTNRILFYGDSIVAGAGATSPVQEAFVQLVREARSESVMAEAWGYRGLYDDAHTTPLLNNLVALIVACQKAGELNYLWIEIGTNDHGLPLQSAANFGTQYAALLDALHAALPDLFIFCQSPVVKVLGIGEGANSYGDTLPQYRTQISNAVSTRTSFCRYIDGLTILDTGDLAGDQIHPSTSGHAVYATFIEDYLDALTPVAAFSISSSIDAGSSCIPTNTSTGDGASFVWRVNGTIRSTASEPELATYLRDGSNTIQLTVNNAGQSDSVSHDVTVDRVIVNVAVSEHILGSLVEGVTLFGRVRPIVGGVPQFYTPWKEGALIDIVAPTVPVMDTPSVISGSEIDVSWSAATDLFGVTNYDLQYSASVLFTSPTTIPLGNVLSHNVTGLSGSTTYYFRVRAKDAAGNASAYSSSVSGDTGTTTISLVAHTSASSPDHNNVTSGSIDTSGASLLVVAVSLQGLGTGTLTDSKSNTWVALTERESSLSIIKLYYCKNPTVGSGHTFTFSTTARYPAICIQAWNSTDTTANADGDVGAFGTGTTIQPGSLTPSQDNSVVVTAVTGEQSVPASINSGFTISDQQIFATGAAFQVAMAYKLQGAAAAVNPTWDLSTTDFGGALAATMTSFKHN